MLSESFSGNLDSWFQGTALINTDPSLGTKIREKTVPGILVLGS